MKAVHDYYLSFCWIETFMGNDTGNLTADWLCDYCVSFTRVMLLLFSPLFGIATSQHQGDYIVTDQVWYCKGLLMLFFVMIYFILTPIDIDPKVIHEHINIFMRCTDAFHKHSQHITETTFRRRNKTSCHCLCWKRRSKYIALWDVVTIWYVRVRFSSWNQSLRYWGK